MQSAPILQAEPVIREPLPRWYAPARKAVALLLTAVFLAVLVVPTILADFRSERKTAAHENRSLHAFPQWSWKQITRFPTRFEAAFNDHFGLRDELVLWHHRLVLKVLGSSPVESITVGRDGWLFWGDGVKEHCGIRKIGRSEVQRWREVLLAKKAWLAARGVKYVLVVAPNKEQIYTEHLPALMRRDGGRFLDPILASVGSEVDILDLRSMLLAAKPLGTVYDRTDTHWSFLGAFLSSNEVVRHLQPAFPSLTPADLKARGFLDETGPGGDLAHIMGLPAEIPETRPMVPRFTGLYREGGEPRFDPKWKSMFTATLVTDRQQSEGLPVVFISGDSFGNSLMSYLPEFVGRAVRVWPKIPYPEAFQAALPELIQAEKPDVYIDILCERHLKGAPQGVIPAN